MFRPRVIPCLLLSNGGIVKTTRFDKKRYVGDPINIINIYNQLEADEIILLDIDAPRTESAPQFELIAQIAEECMVPLTYGGGLRSIGDVRRVIEIGVEKVVLNSAAVPGNSLIPEVVDVFGSQSVVAGIDCRRRLMSSKYAVCVKGGKVALKTDPVAHARWAIGQGAGEIMLTSIDRDGTMEGYDLALIEAVCAEASVPVIACGGAGRREDLVQPIRHGASAVAAGSLFVYQNRERGILVNFPDQAELSTLFS